MEQLEAQADLLRKPCQKHSLQQGKHEPGDTRTYGFNLPATLLSAPFMGTSLSPAPSQS